MQSISCYTSRTFGLQPGPGCAALCREHRGSPARQERAPGVDAREPLWARRADLAPGLSPVVEQAREARRGTASRLVTSSAPCTSAHHPDRARPARRWEALPATRPRHPCRLPCPRSESGLTSGGKPCLNFLCLNTPFAGWLPLGPWARSRKPRCRNPASGRPKRTPSSHQAREAQALACGSHSSSSPSGSARGAAHRGLRDPAPRPTPHTAAGPRGHGPCAAAGSHREGPGAAGGSAAVGREAAARGAFSGGRGGLGGSDSVCCVQGVSPVGSGSIGCKLAPRNVLELTEESFPSEQRFTKCVSPQSCPVSRALRVRVEERPFGGLTVHRLAGPGLSGPLTRDGADRPGRAQQGAFPTRAHRRTRGGWS